jgi:tRNA (guanine37-N1)-methyltransferase
MEPQPNSESAPSSKSSSNQTVGFFFLTLFPEMIEPALGASVLAKARQKGLVSFEVIQIRDFSQDKHRTVDDTPYGGGAGMLMKVDVLYAAWKATYERAVSAAGGDASRVLTVLLSPQGPCLDQAMAKVLSTQYSRIILVSGHYEGVDERFIELCVDQEISIGNYVLTGGELPSLVIADAVTRLIPGVLAIYPTTGVYGAECTPGSGGRGPRQDCPVARRSFE